MLLFAQETETPDPRSARPTLIADEPEEAIERVVILGQRVDDPPADHVALPRR